MSEENETPIHGGRLEIENSFKMSAEEEVVSAGATERASLREQLSTDVEAFLAGGGSIREIAPNVVADPPKKPQSNYGGQPI